MEVHAHTHTERKRWTHYLWEFFMLFLAITLGFFAESWREHQWEHRKAKEYAIQLKMELINDTMALSRLINIRDSQLYFISRFRERSKLADKDLTIADLKTHEIELPSFKPRNSTYLQLKNSGDLRFFQDINIKTQLGYYDWSFNNAEQIFKTLTATGGGLFSDYVFQHDLHLDSFLEKAGSLSGETNAMKAGYDFYYRKEYNSILNSMADGLEYLYAIVYPDLLAQARNLIKSLNEEFHLINKLH